MTFFTLCFGRLLYFPTSSFKLFRRLLSKEVTFVDQPTFHQLDSNLKRLEFVEELLKL